MKHYDIPIGKFFTGDVACLFFTNDHDASPADALSLYSNIRIYESDPSVRASVDTTAAFAFAAEEEVPIVREDDILSREAYEVLDDASPGDTSNAMSLTDAELTRIAYELAEGEMEARSDDDEPLKARAVDLAMLQTDWPR